MKRNLLIAISVFFALQIQLKAQEKIVVLHPLVGEIIDKIEMDKYELFAEYRNVGIEYFILNTSNDIIHLIGMMGQEISFKKEVGSAYISKQRENVEKLNNYYSSFFNIDSTSLRIKKQNPLNIETLKVNQKIVTPEILESIKQDLRRDGALKQAAEVEKNRRKGFKN
jgi:hypothetical protein